MKNIKKYLMNIKKKAMDEFEEKWNRENPNVNLHIHGDIPID